MLLLVIKRVIPFKNPQTHLGSVAPWALWTWHLWLVTCCRMQWFHFLLLDRPPFITSTRIMWFLYMGQHKVWDGSTFTFYLTSNTSITLHLALPLSMLNNPELCPLSSYVTSGHTANHLCDFSLGASSKGDHFVSSKSSTLPAATCLCPLDTRKWIIRWQLTVEESIGFQTKNIETGTGPAEIATEDRSVLLITVCMDFLTWHCVEWKNKDFLHSDGLFSWETVWSSGQGTGVGVRRF